MSDVVGASIGIHLPTTVRVLGAVSESLTIIASSRLTVSPIMVVALEVASADVIPVSSLVVNVNVVLLVTEATVRVPS